MEHSQQDSDSVLHYNCVCLKHNFSIPHVVSSATWYCHFEEASSPEEYERMRAAKANSSANARP